MIKAEELKRSIEFQVESGAADSYGAPGGTWTKFANVRAAVISSGGREFYSAQKVNAETQILFQVRYRNDLNVRMRIYYAGKYYDIININDKDAAHAELLISAKEVV